MGQPTPPPIGLSEGTARVSIRTRLQRLLRLAKLLSSDSRVPRPIRVLILAGLLPVPGPFDEIVLGGSLALLLVIRQGLIRTLWLESAAEPSLPDGDAGSSLITRFSTRRTMK